MKSPSLITIKTLFARSPNRCAFPGCHAPLAEETGTVTAEICHIRALNSKGPRYDKSQTPEERNAAANLILMCGRHHKIIDSEPRTYTVAVLQKYKQEHEIRGVVEISAMTTRVAERILANYAQSTVTGNRGNVAIHSPGAIQAKSVTIKNTSAKISIEPPSGSIGADRAKRAYCKYLIDRYQKYQKGDRTGKSDFKYIAIHEALKRTFRAPWELLSIEQFDDLVSYLQKRIDATIIGKLNHGKGHRNYSSFAAWQEDA